MKEIRRYYTVIGRRKAVPPNVFLTKAEALKAVERNYINPHRQVLVGTCDEPNRPANREWIEARLRGRRKEYSIVELQPNELDNRRYY